MCQKHAAAYSPENIELADGFALRQYPGQVLAGTAAAPIWSLFTLEDCAAAVRHPPGGQVETRALCISEWYRLLGLSTCLERRLQEILGSSLSQGLCPLR